MRSVTWNEIGVFRSLAKKAVSRFARRFPFLIRRLILLSMKGYMPPIHRRATFRSLAAELLLFEREGIPIWRTPYSLYIPRELMDAYLNYQNYLEHEPKTQRIFWMLLKPGFVVIDVGANIGYYTLLAASAVGPSGKVHAVECAPDNLKALKYNVEKNKLSNVHIHPFAAASTRTTQQLNVSPIGLMGFSPSAQVPTVYPGKGTAVDVSAVPLDDVISSPVHLVKIDVDGFELDVLKGMKRILSENQHLSLIVEWAPMLIAGDGGDPLELLTWLEGAGLRQIMVLETLHEKKPRSLNEAKQWVRDQSLPPNWVCNLLARR
jgi:FkbM family methyltransferase